MACWSRHANGTIGIAIGMPIV